MSQSGSYSLNGVYRTNGCCAGTSTAVNYNYNSTSSSNYSNSSTPSSSYSMTVTSVGGRNYGVPSNCIFTSYSNSNTNNGK